MIDAQWEWLTGYADGAWREKQISWDDLWLLTSHLVSKRSRCDRDRVGAVLVTADNRVLSVGYNGAPATYRGDVGGSCATWCERAATTPKGVAGTPEYHDCPASHAEVNCLLRAPAHSSDSTLYVSTIPCQSCAKFIGTCRTTKGITRLVAARGGVGDAYRNQYAALSFIERCEIVVQLFPSVV